MTHSILIVDDEAAVTLPLEGFFRDRGYQVLKAFYGDQALERIETARPSLVILDLQMPQLDGIAVLEKIRSSYPGIKTLVITAYWDRYEKDLERLKPEAIKLKPVSLEELAQEAQVLLGEKKPRPLKEGSAPGGPLRLLFVVGVRELYGKFLKPYFEDPHRKIPFQTALATGPEEALRQLESFQPHLVVLDSMRMPVGADPGKLASELMRASPLLKEVILVSLKVPLRQMEEMPMEELQKLEERINFDAAK